MKPTLTILSGERAGEKMVLAESKRYIFGRDHSADLTLAEKKISRRHASLFWDENRKEIFLEDLNSLNGTYLNGELLARPVRLRDKDRIQIGSFLLQLSLPEDAASLLSSEESSIFELSSPQKTDPRSPTRGSHIEHLEQTGGRMISGKLEDLALADLLQMLATTKKTGRLILSKKKILNLPKPGSTTSEVASLYLVNGDLVHADFRGKQNEEAFFQVLTWMTGYFALFPHDNFEFGNVLETPLEALLLEGFRRLDESRANQLELHSKDTFEVDLDEPLDSLKPDEIKIFQLAWKQKSMGNIWKNSSFEKDKTTDLVRQLLKKGFLRREG